MNAIPLYSKCFILYVGFFLPEFTIIIRNTECVLAEFLFWVQI